MHSILPSVQPPFCHISLNSLKLLFFHSFPSNLLTVIALSAPCFFVYLYKVFLFYVCKGMYPALLSRLLVSPLLNKADLKPPACLSVSLLGFFSSCTSATLLKTFWTFSLLFKPQSLLVQPFLYSLLLHVETRTYGNTIHSLNVRTAATVPMHQKTLTVAHSQIYIK